MTSTGARGAATGETLSWEGLHTWYRVVRPPVGPHNDHAAPVIICHGGPGISHDYLVSLAALAMRGHPCVFYDQIGCGNSDRLPGAAPGFWSVELFLRELDELLGVLGFGDGYHLLGHSWGGMLALEHAARRPAGLRSIVVADAYASSATYISEIGKLVDALPSAARDGIHRNDAAGTIDTPDYQQAMRTFYGRHTCRVRPVPEELIRTLTMLGEDARVYEAMCGPNEFTMTGRLRTWDITDRLADIEVPALLVSGRHDQVAPPCVAQLWAGLHTADWVVFEESSHMPHLEEPERFLATVGEFLAR